MTLLGRDKDRPDDFPNGIALSPDEKVLYVTAGFGKTMRCNVLPDDIVTGGSLFIPAGKRQYEDGSEGRPLLDERCFSRRDLDHIAGGKHLGTIQLPQSTQNEPRPRIGPTNVAFGYADGKVFTSQPVRTCFASVSGPPGILPGPKDR